MSSSHTQPGIISRFRSAIARAIEPRAIKYNEVSPSSSAAAEYFGLPSTAAGVWIDEQAAMRIGTFFACIRNIADDTSKCSMIIGEHTPDGGRRVIRDDPLHHVLNVEANPEMSAKVFRETLMAHAVSWGNGYAEIQWRVDGRVGALWPLMPDRMKVTRAAGGLQYVYDGKPIRWENVVHVPGLGWDGRVGYSPARMARESLGSVVATERFGAAFFGNGARMSGALMHPGKLGDKAYANLKQSLQQEHGGPFNAGRPIILEEGMKWEQLSVPPEDAQFLLTRQFQVPEICRWFRMPPHKVADLTKATFSNIEHQSIEYVTDCLLGWFIRLEQELDRKCLRGRPNMYCKHNANTLLRGDAKTRFESYGIGRQWGWLTVNNILRLEDMDPIGPDGDIYMVPANMQAASVMRAGGAPDEPTPPSPNEDARAARVVEAFKEQASLLIKSMRSVERDKATRAESPEAFRAMHESFMPRHTTFVRDRFEHMARLIAGAVRAACPSLGELRVKVAAARSAQAAWESHINRLGDRAGWMAESSGAEAEEFIQLFIQELRSMSGEGVDPCH